VAEEIKVLDGVKTLEDLRNIVLVGLSVFPMGLMRPSPDYFGHLFGPLAVFLLKEDCCASRLPVCSIRLTQLSLMV